MQPSAPPVPATLGRRESLRRRRVWLAGGTVAVLALWNNVVQLHPAVGGAGYVPANLALAAALLVVGRLAGLDLAAVGLGAGRGRRAAMACAVVVAVVAVGLTLALAIPATRPLLADGRFAGRDAAAIVWHAFGRVPFGTALLEEVAFRGVLLGLLGSLVGVRRAVVLSSLLFGVWHVRPGWSMLAANGAALDVVGMAGVLATVAVTAAAGVGFCWLRLRAGHLAAPFVAHAGMNALGTLAAYVALRG